MKCKRIAALIVAMAITVSLAACKGDQPPVQSGPPSPSPTPSAAPTAVPSVPPSAQPSSTAVPAAEPLRLGLSGSLASMGVATLLTDSDALGEDSPYRWTPGDEAELRTGLLGGTLDVAVLSPAKALELYHATDGQIRIVAAVAADGQPGQDILAALKAPRSGTDLNPDYRAVIAVAVSLAPVLQLRSDDIRELVPAYASSMASALYDPEQYGQDMVRLGLASDASLAARAVTQCLPILLTSRDMAAAMSVYYEVLFQTDPALVAGGLPDDGIYSLL